MGILDGKVVVVTGSGGGIGEAIVRHLFEEAATAVATAHSEASVEKLTEQIGDSAKFVGRALDVTDESQVAEVIADTVRQFGRLDGIVNNAGVLYPNTTDQATTDEYEKTFDVNVKGTFLAASMPFQRCWTVVAARSSTSVPSTRSALRSSSRFIPRARARCSC